LIIESIPALATLQYPQTDRCPWNTSARKGKGNGHDLAVSSNGSLPLELTTVALYKLNKKEEK
jgi:hypothetical protein